MSGHRVKLDRALQHMEALDDELRAWVNTKPYSLFFEFDPVMVEGGVWVGFIQKPPETIGGLIGDCIHNLRSSLDHLAYELAVAFRGEPLPQAVAEHSEFPIFSDRLMREDEQERKIGGIHPDAQAIIKSLQPAVRGKDQNLPDPASNSLWLLHELERIDKHRTLHVTLMSPGPVVLAGSNVAFTGGGSSTGPLEHGTQLMRFLPSVDPNENMQVKFDMTFGVAFENGPPAHGQGVITTLQRLNDYIESEVLSPLTPFL